MNEATILFIIFLILKLTGIIALSWLWVTAPLWIGLALGVTVFFGALIIGFVIAIARSF